MSAASLREELRSIAEAAEWHARNYVLEDGPDQAALEGAIADFMAVYCDVAALLAADWYNAIDGSRYFATPVAVVPPQRARDTADWVFRSLSDPTPEKVARRAGAAAFTMAYDAARDTVAANATREGVAFVRVEEPNACDDCMKRATANPRSSRHSSEDVSWERHQRCEFLFVPVRREVWTPSADVLDWHESRRSRKFAGPVIANSTSAH